MEAGVSQLLSSVQSTLMSELGDALPIAGGVMAVVAGIYLGVKLFKRLTGART